MRRQTTVTRIILLATTSTLGLVFAPSTLAISIDGDTDLDLDDFILFNDCRSGPAGSPPVECVPADLDTDGDVDLADFQLFANAFTGPFVDCNTNGVPDEEDIAQGTSQDCQPNNVPDECELILMTPPCHFSDVLADNTTGVEDWVFTGPPDASEEHPENFGGLGGQQVTYHFDCATIVNGPGPDITVYEVNYGVSEFDGIDVLVSANGTDFVSIRGTQSPAANIPGDEAHGNNDFARSYELTGSGLTEVRYIRLDGDGDEPGGGTSGFDLDAVGAVYVEGFEIDNDCNTNCVPDECDLAGGTSQDCQPNGVPDECDIAAGTSQDTNGNDIPDECELSTATRTACRTTRTLRPAPAWTVSPTAYLTNVTSPAAPARTVNRTACRTNVIWWLACCTRVSCTGTGLTATPRIRYPGLTLFCTTVPR